MKAINRHQHPNQTGIAIIMVLLILAIVAITTAALTKQHQFDQAMASQLIHMGQAKAHIQGAEMWAAQILQQDRQNNKIDHLAEAWAQPVPPMPVEQGVISGQMTDLQGRFNLNSIVSDNKINKPAMAAFQRLLEQQELDPKLGWYLADWIDSDAETQQGTLEDAYYLSQATPYRSANQPLLHLSELGLVRGFELADVALLKPLVSALPENTQVNVNSAGANVLMALSDAINQSTAEQLISARNDQPWQQSEDFLAAVLGNKNDQNAAQRETLAQLVTVSSNYFKLRVAAQFGVAKTHLESKLYRSDTAKVDTIARIYTP